MAVKRRLVAVVMADVVGYSRLMERDEAGTHERLRELKSRLIDPKIAEHGGRIVKTTGDGLLVEFPSATSALRCAVEIQREMGVRNLYVAPEDKIQFRLGINLGDIIVEGDDILGDGVNVAARLETLAEPGGICVASAVWEQVHEDLGVEFVDSGEQHVKNISKPIRVFRVALGKGGAADHHAPLTAPIDEAAAPARASARRWTLGAALALVVAVGVSLGWWRMHAPERPPERASTDVPLRSLLIVPFTAPAGDAEMTAEAQRLSADVARAFANSVPEARVTQPAVAAALAAKTPDLAAMAHEANARFVIDGELRTSADQVVATLRFFDARDARQLQTERRAVPRARLADAHDELVRQTTAATRVMYYDAVTKATPGASDRTTSRQAFLEQVAKIRISDQVGLSKEFRRLADEALRRDPNLAIALAFRADADVGLLWNDYDFTGDRDRLLAEADADSLRAITLDERNPLAWNVRGRVLAARGDLVAALEANDHAQQLDPTRFSILLQRGWIDFVGGRDADALQIVDALRAPMAADSSTWLLLACAAHVQLGDYDSAVTECERAVSGADGWLPYANLAAAYAMRGDMDKAARARAKLLAAAPSFTISRYEGKRYYIGADAAARDREHMIPGLRKAGVPE